MYNIHKFDIDDIKSMNVIKIIGEQFSGKTTLAKNIIYHINNDKTKTVIIFTQYSHKYKNIASEKLIYHTFLDYDNIIEKIIEEQKKQIINKEIIIVFDNIPNLNNLPNFRELLFNGRHYGITIIIVVDARFVNPLLIECFYRQTDIIFALLIHDRQKRKLYEIYNLDMTYNIFKHHIYKCTKNHGCFVINNNVSVNAEYINWYRVIMDHNTLQHKNKIIKILKNYIIGDVINIVTQYLSMTISDKMCLYCS